MILVLSFFPLVFGDAKRGWLKGDWKNHRAGLGLKQNEGMLWKIDIFFHNWVCCFFSTKCFFTFVYGYIYIHITCIIVYIYLYIYYTPNIWYAVCLGESWIDEMPFNLEGFHHNGCSHTMVAATPLWLEHEYTSWRVPRVFNPLVCLQTISIQIQDDRRGSHHKMDVTE